jgi:hypothetical protein
VRQQSLVQNLPVELLVELVAQLHLEQMLVWLERWRVRLQRGKPKLVTAVSAHISLIH